MAQIVLAVKYIVSNIVTVVVIVISVILIVDIIIWRSNIQMSNELKAVTNTAIDGSQSGDI